MKQQIGLARLCSLLVFSTTVAAAQEQRYSTMTELEEIVVTAQKREQLLQDVPISMTVLSADFIQKSNLREFEDYALFVPAVSFDKSARAASDVRIRGIGRLGGSQNTYGVYVDGFEITGGTELGSRSKLLDIERLEVLRGPQGTAFGRNVVAGAVNITSKAPDTQALSGRVSAGVSKFGGYEAAGAINLPFSDATAVRVSGYRDHTDGHIKNIGSAGGRNDADESGVRIAIRSELTDFLTASGAVSYEKVDQGLFNSLPDGRPTGLAALFVAAIPARIAQGLLPADTLPLAPGAFYPDQNSVVAFNTPGHNDIRTLISTARLDYDLGQTSLVWVNGFIRSEIDSLTDLDQSELDVLLMASDNVSKFYSTELRWQSNGDQRLDWVAGAYAAHGETRGRGLDVITGTQSAIVTGIPNGVIAQGSYGEGESAHYAVFADTEFAVTDRLALLGGARYNNDHNEAQASDIVLLPVNSIPDRPLTDTSSDKVTWRGSVVYDWTQDFSTYGVISTGYRAGGLQLGNPVRTDFGPESIRNYEIGAKGSFLDGRVGANFAVFLMDWENVQISVRDPLTLVAFTDNAGEARARGVELDFGVNPLEGLNISGGVAYVDSELLKVSDTHNDPREGSPLPLAPEWTLNTTIDYQHLLVRDLEGFIRASYIYNSEKNDDLVVAGATPLLYPAYDRIDLRAGVDWNGWRIEGFVENLLDDRYIVGQDLNAGGLTGSAIITFPRLYGMRISKEFDVL